MGLAPIGCAPHYLWKYSSENGECVEEINDMILEFNFEMRYMVEMLRQELLDSNIIFCDMYEGSMDIIQNYQHYGQIISTSLPNERSFSLYISYVVCLFFRFQFY